MLRLCLIALLVACGSSGMGTPDGGGDDTTGDGGGSDDPNTPHTVKLTLTNRPMNAAPFSFVVAYQDGGAPWQLAPAPSGDTYSLEIHAPSYGVAFTCISTQGGTTSAELRTVTAAHFAVGERTEVTLDVPARCSDRTTANNIALTGTVTNRPFGGFLYVAWGPYTGTVGSQSGNFQVRAQAGTHDLFVIHGVPTGNGDFYADEVWIARDVTLNASATRQINFNNAQPTQQLAVDLPGVDPNARVNVSTTLYTANGTNALLVRKSTDPETQMLSAAQTKATDLFDQSITVSTFGRGATITHATNTPDAQTWSAPPPLGQPQTTVASDTPYPTLQTLWPAYANVEGYVWNATQQLASQQCGGGNAPCTISWSAVLSPGVTGMMPGYRMPDLSALTGWESAFELVADQQVFGSVTAFTSTAGASDFPPGIPASGTDRTFVRADYAVTP